MWLIVSKSGRAWPRLLVFLGALLLFGQLCAQTEGGKRLTHLSAFDFFRSRLCQTCDLNGYVGDCGCRFDTVNEANREHFMPLLSDLVKRTFFRYFKVNLNKECPFWHEEMMCSIRDCAVVECEASEVPPLWIEKDAQGRTVRECIGDSDTSLSDIERLLGSVDRKEADTGVDKFKGWAEGDNTAVWIEQEAEDRDMVYINLLRNPERFTGYAGPSARRVWTAMYQDNCFELSPSEMTAGEHCFEKRIFYRLIAGLQSSISTHLALYLFTQDDHNPNDDYRDFYDKDKDRWIPNTQLYVEKVGMHPDRINNLYFTYLFLMRAINKAGIDLMHYDYNTGNPADDELVRSSMKVLAYSSSNASAGDSTEICHRAFDETSMFQPRSYTDNEEQELHKLRQEFFTKFHNISRIMDCVGCEKCRLWGKLQILGLGTAIKIVLGSTEDKIGGKFSFQRNEVIALVNTAHQLAKSVKAVEDFQKREFDEIIQHWMWVGGLCLITLGIVLGLILRSRAASRQHLSPSKASRRKSKKEE